MFTSTTVVIPRLWLTKDCYGQHFRRVAQPNRPLSPGVEVVEILKILNRPAFLTVRHQERTYTARRVPGGFLRRDGRLSDKETLTYSVIDNWPVRPQFCQQEAGREVSKYIGSWVLWAQYLSHFRWLTCWHFVVFAWWFPLTINGYLYTGEIRAAPHTRAASLCLGGSATLP